MMKQGKYVGSYAPYGYVLHPKVRNKLAVDPEAAQVVRRIFDLAIAGTKVTDIAKQLNIEGVPTPSQYFIANHPGTEKFGNSSNKLLWSYTAVYNILTKLTYTGATVGHVSKTVVPLSKQVKKQLPEDWIVAENMHEAIVSKDDFDKAQAIIRKQKQARNAGSHKCLYVPASLSGALRQRGRAMTYDKRRKGFYCPYPKTDPNSFCPRGIVCLSQELEKVVFDYDFFATTSGCFQAAYVKIATTEEKRH